MDGLGIQPAALAEKCYAKDIYTGLGQGIFFDRETFGTDKLLPGAPSEFANPTREVIV
jgi:hypothetical protein